MSDQMIFADSAPTDGSRVLEELDRAIDRRELDRLSTEAGFSDPNDFPFDRILRILESHRYPDSDHADIGWAIYECGMDRIRTYSPMVRLFACSIYLHAHKVRAFDGNFDSGFFYQLVEGALEAHDPQYLALTQRFVQWLHEHVPSDRHYDDHLLLLAWVLLRLRSGNAGDATFHEVVSRMLAKRLSPLDIRLGNDCVFPQPDDWLALLERVPATPAFDPAVLLPVIFGFDE